MTGTVIALPPKNRATGVPHGSVRWATPSSAWLITWPHAVCLP
jgi:hypothetical protein